jgi:hypothetical protein
MQLTRRRALAFIAALILFGFALRLYRLDAVPLRGDEAFSAQNWAGLPLSTSLQTIATLEPHPPLTYAAFRGWGWVFGIDHEFVLRLLPALANLIGIPALYVLGVRLHGRTAGILAALLWACHPYQIWHAQDFRNYALWSGMSAITFWAGLRVVQGHRQTRDWALYGLMLAVTWQIFYFEAFSVLVLGIYALLIHGRDRRFMLLFAALTGIIGSGVIATFLALQGALVGSGGYTGTTDHLALEQLITRFLPALTFGETIPPDTATTIGIITAVILSAGLALIARRLPRTALLLGIWGILPPALIAIVSLKLGIFNPRYVMLVAPAYTLIFSIGVVMLWNQDIVLRSYRRVLASGLLVAWLGVCAYSLNNYFHDSAYPRKAPAWGELTDYLEANVTADDLVIQTAVDAAFGYYYQGAALDIGLPDNFDQPIPEIEAYLETNHTQYRSLWVTATTFTSWQNAGVVEKWVDEHMQRVRTTNTDGLPIRQYMTWEVQPAEVDGEPLAEFQATAQLAEARLFLPPEPTHELTLWLYWQPIQRTPTSLKVFVHLIGDVNPATGTPLWAQADLPPQQGRISTENWQLTTLYRDVYALNIRDVPAGEYEVLVGLYDPATSERVLTTDGADTVLIDRIQLP